MAVQGRIDMNYDFLEGYGKKEDAYIAKGKGLLSGIWTVAVPRQLQPMGK